MIDAARDVEACRPTSAGGHACRRSAASREVARQRRQRSTMSWQGIEGHDDVVERFRRALARGRLASTFLFVGPPGIGKRAFAEKLAQALLVSGQSPAESLAPCGRCDAVRAGRVAHASRFASSSKSRPTRARFRCSCSSATTTHRMREGLCHDIALKPFMGGRKVAIIDDADYLNEESANCLLKTLEEPPPRSVLDPDRHQRRQAIAHDSLALPDRFAFGRSSADSVAEILVERGLVADARRPSGWPSSPRAACRRAVELADDDAVDVSPASCSRRWRRRGSTASAWHAELVAFVDAAGKEAPRPPRSSATGHRLRGRLLSPIAAGAIRHWRSGATPCLSAAVEQPVAIGRSTARSPRHASIARWRRWRTSIATPISRRSLECWLDDLARIVETGQPAASYRAIDARRARFRLPSRHAASAPACGRRRDCDARTDRFPARCPTTAGRRARER